MVYFWEKIIQYTNNINVNNISSDRKGYELLSEIAEKIRLKPPLYVDLDFNNCTFFEANMVSPLYAVLVNYANQRKIHCKNMKDNIKKAFMRNNFAGYLGFDSVNEDNAMTLPFKIFASEDDSANKFFLYLRQYFREKGLPKMTEALTRKFHQNLLEILINAVNHSKSQTGIFTCGQYYPRKKRLDFTISDAGIGIRENVVGYTGEEISATDAIRWALKKGNTTRRSETPGGLGLDLLKEFITLNGGKLQIVSATGYYEYSNGRENDKKSNDMEYRFPGTSINIEVNATDKKTYGLKSEPKI